VPTPSSAATSLKEQARELAARIEQAAGWQQAVVIFAIVLVIYFATGGVSRDDVSPDAVAAALPAWAWATHHTLYLDHVTVPNVWVYAPRSHLISNRSPGVIFFGIPFYVAVGRTAIFSMFPAVLAAATAAAGAIAFLFSAVRRVTNTRVALLVAAMLAFGTATWSVAADTLWPHAPDELMLAAAMYFLSRERYLRSAIAIALCIPIRAHVAVLALVAGTWLAVRRRSAWPLLTFGGPAAIGVAALALYDHWIFGGWTIAGGYPYVSRDLGKLLGSGHVSWPMNIVGALVSTDRGLLVWCPLVLVLAFATRPAWRAAPDWVRISAIGALGYFLIQMKLNYFSGGDRFWSYRLTLEPLILLTPLLMLAAIEIAHRRLIWQNIAIAAGLYGVGTQMIGAIFYTPNDLVHHSPWRYSHLVHELRYAGIGPRVVLAGTAAVIVVAIAIRTRLAHGVSEPQPEPAPA
jgi:alpha-1,2-mannosyltransferase